MFLQSDFHMQKSELETVIEKAGYFLFKILLWIKFSWNVLESSKKI